MKLRKASLKSVLLIAIAAVIGSILIAPPAIASGVTYSQSFTGGSNASSTASNAWGTYRTSLTGSYSQLTISSSLGQSITLNDPTKIQNIANRLQQWSTNSQTYNETIGSTVISIGNCGSGPELTVGPSASLCNCYSTSNSGYITVRPQIGTGNSNWGGAGKTCNASSQTLTVTFGVAVVSISSFTSAQSTPTNTTGAINYSLSFSSSVSGLAAGDFTNAGTATGCGFSPSSSSGTSFTISVTNCSEGTLIPRLAQNSVTDSSSNFLPSSATNASTTITIDRTNPSTPSTPDLAAASDSGQSSTDNYTNDTTPTFTGTAENSTTITLLVDGSSSGSCTLTATNYTCTSASLAAGDYVITIRSTDAASNSSTSSSLTITIDTQGPQVNSHIASFQFSFSLRSISHSVTFSEAIFDFTIADISSSSNWTIGAINNTTGNSYTFLLTNPSPTNGTVTATINLAQISDLAGNTGSGTSIANTSFQRATQIGNWIKFLWGEELQRF